MTARGVLVVVLLVLAIAAPAAAQDYATDEVDVFWYGEQTGEQVEILLTGDATLAGLRDHDYCRFMSFILDAGEGGVDDCVEALVALSDRAWLPESMLRIISPPLGDGRHRLSGVMRLHDPDSNWQEGSSCRGRGDDRDFRPGMQVRVRDGDGALLAAADLQRGQTRSSDACDLPFVFEDLPEMPLYILEAGPRVVLARSLGALQQLGWTLVIRVG